MSARPCPACGVAVDEEAFVCEACGCGLIPKTISIYDLGSGGIDVALAALKEVAAERDRLVAELAEAQREARSANAVVVKVAREREAAGYRAGVDACKAIVATQTMAGGARAALEDAYVKMDALAPAAAPAAPAPRCLPYICCRCGTTHSHVRCCVHSSGYDKEPAAPEDAEGSDR